MSEHKVRCPNCKTERFSVEKIDLIGNYPDKIEGYDFGSKGMRFELVVNLTANCSSCDKVTGNYRANFNMDNLILVSDKLVGCSNCSCTELRPLVKNNAELYLQCKACSKNHSCGIETLVKE